MKKVLLLSCLISMTAHAGTGGGTSTPPAKAGLAKLLAETLGLSSRDGTFRFSSVEPLPLEIKVSVDSNAAPALEQLNIVEVSNLLGATRSYRIFDGEADRELILKDRRETMRASILR